MLFVGEELIIYDQDDMPRLATISEFEDQGEYYTVIINISFTDEYFGIILQKQDLIPQTTH